MFARVSRYIRLVLDIMWGTYSTYSLANPPVYYLYIILAHFFDVIELLSNDRFSLFIDIFNCLGFFYKYRKKNVYKPYSSCIFPSMSLRLRVYHNLHDKIKYPSHCKGANRHARFCYIRLTEWAQIRTITFQNFLENKKNNFNFRSCRVFWPELSIYYNILLELSSFSPKKSETRRSKHVIFSMHFVGSVSLLKRYNM